MNRVNMCGAVTLAILIALSTSRVEAAQKHRAAQSGQPLSAELFLTPHLRPGEVLGDVTSRMIAAHAEGKVD
jgi:hypothetical protein